ncbi:anti-sigma factor [Rosenbergiella nectarea]|uniref:anti-sigma factor n=1 Tax=Rosenbergiella nectarea TaxID=988801 RepID=UPI001F4EFDD5|nr:anti-sigma factor [Rosenbergiella nectarea]
MSKAGLQIEKGQEYIAVKVEGIPLGRYAPQIFQLLSQHGLDTVRVALAQPVFSDQGIALQWFPQVSAQTLTPWRQATLSQQVRCLAQLIEMAKSIDALRQHLTPPSSRSLTIIDQILQNLTVIPSIEAIFLADQQPLLLHWGYYSQDRIAVDLPSLYHRLQQQLEAESPPPPCEHTEISPSHPTQRAFIYYLAAAVVALFILGAIALNATRPGLKQPLATYPPVVSTVDEVKKSLEGAIAASRALPLHPAELIAPPPEVKPIQVKKTRVPLMIPARSRYLGNTDFLEGAWLANLNKNNKITTLSYHFTHGQAKTLIVTGQQNCSTTSQASFTSTGKLIINATKARCNDGTTLPAITLICEKSAPNTQCRWKQNPSTPQPIELYSERKQ